MIRLIGILLFLAVSLGSFAQDKENIELLFHWKDTSLVPSDAHFNTYNEIWGYASNGKEYAIIGTTAGTHIFDVSDPVNSTEIEFIPGAMQGNIVVHRDYHDYNDLLYIVCDEGLSTLQIADLSHLPDSAPVVYESDTLIQRSHNIFIDESSALLYTCGGEGQLRVISLANPTNPQLVIDCEIDIPFWNGTIGYVHDIYVRNDTAFCNAGNNGLFLVDFGDLASPVLIGSLEDYPDQGYNHSGYLSNQQPVYVLADETHGMALKLIDVSDPSDMEVHSLVHSEVNDTLSIPHNPLINNEFLFVGYYHDGLYIYDISDPTNPIKAGFYDTSVQQHANNFRGAWGAYPFLPSGLVLVSDMQEGLFVFNASEALGIDREGANVNSINAFPNPFSENINLQVGNESFEVSLVNQLGQIVQQAKVSGSNTIFDVKNGLPSGFYVLLLKNSEKNIAIKLVKK